MDSLEAYTIPFNDLQVLCTIGSVGSAAVIHKALWKTRHNLQVAIKIYTKNPSQKEVDILRKLDHQNIIKFYGIVKSPLASGIVIEYASSGDLFTFLASKRKDKACVRLPRKQFTYWCLDIAVAIQYLHKRHITHKDIKSLNVLISDDIVYEESEESLNILKICDFGISKETTNTESVMSSYGGCTRSWAAPEVIKDHRVVSQKSDIYSLCIVFWELWTCQQPWSGQLDYDIETRVKQGISLEIPADFPQVMKPMMMKCWQMERYRRCEIDDVIECIKCLMSEWQIKVCRDKTSGNLGNNQSEVSTERVQQCEGGGNDVQQQTDLEDQELAELPVLRKEQPEEQSLNINEKVCEISKNSKSLEIKRTDAKEGEDFQDSGIAIQEACNSENDGERYTHTEVPNVDTNEGDLRVHDKNNIYVDLPLNQEIYNVAQTEYQENPEGGVWIKENGSSVAPRSEEDLQSKEEEADKLKEQVTDAVFDDESSEAGIVESGHVAYIVNRFESFDAVEDIEAVKSTITGIGKSSSDTDKSVNNYVSIIFTSTSITIIRQKCDEHPIGSSEVTPISPVPPVIYKNLISPVPKIADYYDDVEGIWLPPEGKSGKELSKLYKHVEESYTDLKLVKEEFIDNDRFHGLLNDGELRHLMTNTVDVESIISRFYTWFKKCSWQIPAICELITNILEADYLQPMINFAIYSQLQMNMLKFIRHGCLDFAEKLTKTQRRDSEDINYTLSFTDLQEILLKQANWLKKFHSILKSLHEALVVEMTEDESVIEDMKECCCKLRRVILNCNEHEGRIIQDIEHHSTSLLHKLRFNAENAEKTKTQRTMVSEESWVKKSGTIYLIDDVKQGKRMSVVEKKCTMMVFVSTVLIVEDKGEYLKVIDCIHKKDVNLQRPVYQNIGCLGSETLVLTKLDPLTKLPVEEYGFTLEDSNEIQEWTKAFEFSEEEKISQDKEYITPLDILDTTCADPTYEDCYRPIYARMKSIYENVEAIQVLASIITLNKKTTESLSKLRALYIDNVVLSSIIGEGEKHHMYLNVVKVNEVIESFNKCLETNQYDSFHLFTELRKRLDEDSFHPIIEYQAHMCFQRNMLQFQRKHHTAFSQVLGNLERDAQAKWRVSEMDLKLRLSKPGDWLASLFHKLKTLEGVITRDPDHRETFHRLNAETLHMLHQLIQRGQHLRESVEQDSSKHITSVLLKLPIPKINEPRLIQTLSKIQDDWLKKLDSMTLFKKRRWDRVKALKKRYHSTEINLYASTSAIILTSAKHTTESTKTESFCKCYDRNYADVEFLDAKSRQSWMPERDILFKLWIYVKEDGDYKQFEYVLGLHSDRSMEDLMEWKSALVVATGESGVFDDYKRPSHIVSESFTTDREDELHLEVNDFVEILEMQYALDKAWVKGRRLRDQQIGWFPREKLGHEIDSEYSRGQAVKLRYRKEREIGEERTSLTIRTMKSFKM